jgi:indolepyruvate ferredoxin oxidoreductase, alpha subunit
MILLSGNEAVARGAWEAGVVLGTGYPGTPSSEILESLSGYSGLRAQWCPNEKVALEVASGASWAGGRVLVTMKHVGLNVAADPLFTLAYTGIRGGMVIAVADDPGLQSSQNEQDSRHYGRAARLPILEPADSAEARELAIFGFRLSEQFHLPVILRLVTRVSHSRAPIASGRRRRPSRVRIVRDPRRMVMIPKHAEARHRMLEEKLVQLARYAETAPVNRIEKGRSGRKIITSGIAYQYCKETVPDAVYLKLGLVYPLPRQKLKNFARGKAKPFVVEELDPFLATEIRALGIEVRSKRKEYGLGELNPDRVRNLLKDRLEKAPKPSPLPPRPPVMCAGCPHRGVFWVLKKLKVFVTGDIGCYTLGTLPPLAALDTCLCMGAGVGQSEGYRRVLPPEEGRKVAAVIGDSTFLHSGITGLIDIVYNGNGGVVIILDNRTTAMTGHQHHPATGKTLMEEAVFPVSLEAVCRGVGVKRVRVISSYDLPALEDFLRDSLDRPEPSVLIARAPCVLLKGLKKQPPYRVDREKCVACGLCLQSGCPALSAGEDGKVSIDPGACTGCGICAEICPAGAIAPAADH